MVFLWKMNGKDTIFFRLQSLSLRRKFYSKSGKYENNFKTAGWYHVMAAVTVMIWGTTFVSTKVLIKYGLSPVDILFYRFYWHISVSGFLSPCVTGQKLAGRTAVCGAWIVWRLTLFCCRKHCVGDDACFKCITRICTTPVLTALLAPFFYKGDKLKARLVGGSLIALVGGTGCVQWQFHSAA